jgi:deferrochelatase/peroxidase EfeB
MSGRDEIHAVEPGEIILGYPDNRGNWPLTPTAPASSDPDSLLPTVAPPPAGGHAPDLGQSHANLDRDLGRNGTYLVIRQLAQDRGLFEQSVDKVAVACAGHPGVPPGLTAPRLREWIGAKIIGRWRDGTSLVRYPHRPGTGWDGKLDAEPDNAFLLGAEDPVGERCPFGAHIRRTNPRESFEPGSMEQLAISNRHRILRAGRPYETYRREDGGREGEGLFFMCFNADIERQFEFIQQTWSMAPQFHGLENEVDGILGRGEKNGRLTIPTPHGPLQVKGLRDVVQVRGGGYFFVPGKSALDYLCGPSATRPEPSSPGLEAVR